MTSPATLVQRLRESWSAMGWVASKKIDRVLKERREAADRIEALEAEVQRWKSAYDIAHDQASDNGAAAQLLEAEVAVARRIIVGITKRNADLQDGNGNTPTEIRRAIRYCRARALSTTNRGEGSDG